MKYYFLILWLSLKWIFKVNLGDHVWYNGKKYIVANGVRSESWQLSGLENGDSGWVSREQCRKSLTPRNLWHSFAGGYRFYMDAWYSIWKHEGIKEWMRALPIWGNRQSQNGKYGPTKHKENI